VLATLAQRSNARRAAPITSLPDLILAGGELSEVEKATMIGRVSQRRATMPELSRYCSVYARTGACALMSANTATIALSPFRLISLSRLIFSLDSENMTVCNFTAESWRAYF